jgi:hypothetical protein
MADGHEYEMGSGIRDLPSGSVSATPGELIVTGQQNARDGRIGLALYFDPSKYSPVSSVRTPEGSNRAVISNGRVGSGNASEQIYAVAAAWSGSGIKNLSDSLKQLQVKFDEHAEIGGLTFSRTPHPERVDAEPQ